MKQGFPLEFTYLTTLEWTTAAADYRNRNQEKFSDIPVCNNLVSLQSNLEIRKCPENHPSTGYGLHTTVDLQPNTYILDYTGRVDLDDSIPSQNDYCIHLHDKLCVEADANGNEARFINDYFKVSSRPNVAFDTYKDCSGLIAVGVWVLNQPVLKGQELLVTYGHSFWKSRGIAREGPEWEDEWDS
ncbi:hypothetical protein HDV01_006729 [Terramyces sp. JEL0728]|nr:hypothetical protein HDV01_006729 [Terramyces sp. JEL0728]